MKVNPFSVRYPENMTYKQITDYFVDDFVQFNSIMNHNHHFIWGARGSGKSMLLKFIEAKCHAESLEELKCQEVIECPVFPIYYKIANNSLRCEEFGLINQNYAALLSEHMMIMSIARLVFESLECIKDLDSNSLVKYARKIIAECFGIGIDESVAWANSILNVEDDPLEWIDYVCKHELDFLQDYITKIYKKLDAQYLGSMTNYQSFLLPFFRLTKKLLGIDNLEFFILIDEAGRTYEFQQEIINGWVACRNHELLSLKMTAVRAEYVTFYTRDKWTIQNTHDFSETKLNVVHYKEDYKKKLRLVVKKRFEACGLSEVNLDDFYPADKNFEKVLDDERSKLKIEYDNRPENVKESFADYCSRRLMPKVYQSLSDKKLSITYSGFDTLVAVSAGIIRDFLAPSEKMYGAMLDAGYESESITCIDPVIQNEIIQNYSQEFYESIKSSASYSSRDYELLCKLDNLIKALGDYFRRRLLTRDLTEGRIFSFCIKHSEQLSNEEKRVLQLAEMKSLLQKSFYSGKDGSVEDWYVLSRRLAPHFKLDPTALKGRITFQPADISAAMIDPKSFVDSRMNKLKKEKSDWDTGVHQMSLFDGDDDILYAEDDEIEG